MSNADFLQSLDDLPDYDFEEGMEESDDETDT